MREWGLFAKCYIYLFNRYNKMLSYYFLRVFNINLLSCVKKKNYPDFPPFDWVHFFIYYSFSLGFTCFLRLTNPS
jgi:hypothetical protein